MLQYAREIETLPEPADIVLWKFGRCFSHGAIVVQWPQIIHAYCGRACTQEDAEAAGWLSTLETTGRTRPVKSFSVL